MNKFVEMVLNHQMKNRITDIKISKEIGFHDVTWRNIVKGYHRPSQKSLEKLENYARKNQIISSEH